MVSGPPTVPQILDDLDRLVGDLVTGVVLDHSPVTEIGSRRSRETGDQIPPRSTAAQVVQRQQLSGKVIRMRERRRPGDDKADVVGHRGQRRRRRQRLEVLSCLVRPCFRWAEVETVGKNSASKVPFSAIWARSTSRRRTAAVLLSMSGCRHGPAERVLPKVRRCTSRDTWAA